jgi:hypothetical protein
LQVIALRVREDFDEVRVLRVVGERSPITREQVRARFGLTVESAQGRARALREHGQTTA